MLRASRMPHAGRDSGMRFATISVTKLMVSRPAPGAAKRPDVQRNTAGLDRQLRKFVGHNYDRGTIGRRYGEGFRPSR